MSSNLVPEFIEACRAQNQARIEALLPRVAVESPLAMNQGRDLVDDSLRLLFPGMDIDTPGDKDEAARRIAADIRSGRPLEKEPLQLRTNGGWHFHTLIANKPEKAKQPALDNFYNAIEWKAEPYRSQIYWMAATNQLPLIEKLENIPTDDPLLLNIAVLCGHTKMVELLMKKGARQSNILVANACRGTHTDAIFKMLLESGASTHLALHQAVARGNVDRVSQLLSAKADFSEVRASDGTTPLHIACQQNNPGLLTLVLQHTPQDILNLRDAKGDTALDHACATGNVDAVQPLLEHPSITLGNALTIAVQKNKPAVLEILIDYCLRTPQPDIDWSHILNTAAQRDDSTELVNVILTKVTSLTDEMKNKTLDLVYQHSKKAPIILLLLKHGAGQERRMLRRWAIGACYSENREVLLAKCRELVGVRTTQPPAFLWTLDNVNSLSGEEKQAVYDHVTLPEAEKSDTGLKTPFYWAAFMGLTHELKGEYPLENAANREAEWNEALFIASQNGHIDAVRLLLEEGAKVNGIEGQESPLIAACKAKQYDVVRHLLSQGANVNITDPTSGFTPLMIASVAGDDELLSIILEYKPDHTAKTQPDKNHDRLMAVHLACQAGHTHIVKKLIVDHENERTALGYTPTDIANRSEQSSVLSFFDSVRLVNDASLQPIDLTDALRALQAACENEDFETADYLWKRCENLSEHVNSILGNACLEGRINTVRWFLGLNAKMDVNAHLMRACRRGHVNIAEAFLQVGADVNYVAPLIKDTPLTAAVLQNNKPLIQTLVSRKPNFSLANKDGATPVDIAMSNYADDKVIPALFDHENYTEKERSELLVLACKALTNFAQLEKDEHAQVPRRVKAAVTLLLAKGVSPEAKAEAIRLVKGHTSILDLLDPAKPVEQPTATAGVNAGMESVVGPQAKQPEKTVVLIPGMEAAEERNTVQPAESTEVMPGIEPVNRRLPGPTEGERFLQYIKNVAKKFENSHFKPGKEKDRQLKLVITGLEAALRNNPNLTRQELLSYPVNTDMESRQLGSVLNLHRITTKSTSQTKTAKRVERETNPAELKKAVDAFFTKLARRLRFDKTGKYAALQPFLSNRPLFQTIDDLCRYKPAGSDKNLLQVLMMHRDSDKNDSDIETRAVKRFKRDFNVMDHLTQDQYDELLHEGKYLHPDAGQ